MEDLLFLHQTPDFLRNLYPPPPNQSSLPGREKMVFIKLLKKKKITSFLTHTLRRILIISLNEKYNFVRPKKKKNLFLQIRFYCFTQHRHSVCLFTRLHFLLKCTVLEKRSVSYHKTLFIIRCRMHTVSINISRIEDSF